MANIFTTQPDLMIHETQVTRVQETPEGRWAITVAENIVRPSGGGQPQDHATLQTTDGYAPVGLVIKRDGETWIEVDGVLGTPPRPGDRVVLRLDEARRFNLSRCHSLTHLGMAAVRQHVSGYESKGADIAENASDLTLCFRADGPLDGADLRQIDKLLRNFIHRAIPIRAERMRSMEAAALAYPSWRVDPDNTLSGRVRVIHIEGVDANPCSGSHVTNTAQIGPFEIRGCRVDGRGVTNLDLRRVETWMSW